MLNVFKSLITAVCKLMILIEMTFNKSSKRQYEGKGNLYNKINIKIRFPFKQLYFFIKKILKFNISKNILFSVVYFWCIWYVIIVLFGLPSSNPTYTLFYFLKKAKRTSLLEDVRLKGQKTKKDKDSNGKSGWPLG